MQIVFAFDFEAMFEVEPMFEANRLKEVPKPFQAPLSLFDLI